MTARTQRSALPLAVPLLLVGFGTGAGALTGCGSTSQNQKGDGDISATATSSTGQAMTGASTSGSSSTASGGLGGSGGADQTAFTGSTAGGTGGSSASSSSQGGSAGIGGEGGGTISACEDHTVPPGRTPCVGDGDCSGPDVACFLPSSPPPLICGDGCNPPARQCVSDEDCAEGAICVEYEDPCCLALGEDSTGTYCIARCSETSCGDGACGDDGRCVEAPCDPGSCELNQACNTETGRCEFRACSSDEDCDCGFCADVCQNGPGYCDFISSG